MKNNVFKSIKNKSATISISLIAVGFLSWVVHIILHQTHPYVTPYTSWIVLGSIPLGIIALIFAAISKKIICIVLSLLLINSFSLMWFIGSLYYLFLDRLTRV